MFNLMGRHAIIYTDGKCRLQNTEIKIYFTLFLFQFRKKNRFFCADDRIKRFAVVSAVICMLFVDHTVGSQRKIASECFTFNFWTNTLSLSLSLNDLLLHAQQLLLLLLLLPPILL